MPTLPYTAADWLPITSFLSTYTLGSLTPPITHTHPPTHPHPHTYTPTYPPTHTQRRTRTRTTRIHTHRHVSRIETWDAPPGQRVDACLALHCCGLATDYVIDQALKMCAVFVACPCCVGKINNGGGDHGVYVCAGGGVCISVFVRASFLLCLVSLSLSHRVRVHGDDL